MTMMSLEKRRRKTKMLVGVLGYIIIITLLLHYNNNSPTRCTRKKGRGSSSYYTVYAFSSFTTTHTIPTPSSSYNHLNEKSRNCRSSCRRTTTGYNDNNRHGLIFPFSSMKILSSSSSTSSSTTTELASSSSSSSSSSLPTSRRQRQQGNTTTNTNTTTTTRIIISHDCRWDQTFELLVLYKEENGHCNVPRSYKTTTITTNSNTTTKNLGTWLNTQRQAKTKGILDPNKEQKLNQIGIVWGGNVSSQKWNEMLILLEEYKDQYGDCYVPRHYNNNNNNNNNRLLGRWLDRQRQLKKNQKLSRKKQNQLEDIGVVFNINISTGNENENDNENENGTNNNIVTVWTQKWEEMFNYLIWFQIKEGHCNVPKHYTIDTTYTNNDNDTKTKTINLGIWLDTQRRHKKIQKLDSKRQLRLEELGMEWDLHHKTWNYMFTLLQEYKQRVGHCNVPKQYKVEEEVKVEANVILTTTTATATATNDNKNNSNNNEVVVNNLGYWLEYQRARKRRGLLNKKRIQKLDDIGIIWDPNVTNCNSNWDDMYLLLKEYKNSHGQCYNVPQSYKVQVQNDHDKTTTTKHLGTWLYTQRMDKKKGKLDTEKQKQLEDIGVVWDVLLLKWEYMFTLLVQYKEREGNCNVPQDHKEDGENLGAWLTTQRMDKKKEKLHTTKEDKLNNIDGGFIWDLQSHKWDCMFDLLVQYQDREGDCNVPPYYIVGETNDHKNNLGLWLNRQRQNKKNNKLDIKQQHRLKQIGVVWDVQSQKWESMFTLLEEYSQKEGTCSIRRSYKTKDRKNLGIWVQAQHQKKNDGTLDIVLQHRLENIGIIWRENNDKHEKYDDDDNDDRIPKNAFEGMDDLFGDTW